MYINFVFKCSLFQMSILLIGMVRERLIQKKEILAKINASIMIDDIPSTCLSVAELQGMKVRIYYSIYGHTS